MRIPVKQLADIAKILESGIHDQHGKRMEFLVSPKIEVLTNNPSPVANAPERMTFSYENRQWYLISIR